MKREIFNPASEAEWLALREEDITSTQVSALFGSCPYLTLYELWNNKAGILPPAFEPNERVVWGQRLENAIAKGVAEDRGWSIRRKSAYMRLPEIRVGASFDYEILGMDAVLEIKNVSGLAFKDNWIVEGGEIIECPVHIEMQL